MSFIDLSGTKFNRGSFLKMPHTHSLVIVPPKTLSRFQNLVDDEFRIQEELPKTKAIKTYLCPEVAWKNDGLTQTIDCSSKFYRSGYAKCFSEDVRSGIFTMYG